MGSTRVALDAMGGDHAPAVTVEGALRAAGEGTQVLLVGDEALLRRRLEQAGAPAGITIVDASDAVGMGEDAVLAVRTRTRSSIRVACQLVADGEAGAVVSAGSTGATLAAALLTIGRMEGVRRPVVAAVLPVGPRKGVVLADAGGSVDVAPKALVGYAFMAAAYANVLGVAEPRIGLLNVGEEPGKGNELAKAAFALLTQVPGFAGNVEPPAVLAGDVDVVVTDGFTGNVFLKTVESLGLPARHGGGAPRDAAALLLGINGEVLVAHGAADADDVFHAVQRGAQVAAAGLAEQVRLQLAKEEGP